MKKKMIPRNPFLLFSPFLIAYLAFVFLNPSSGLAGDEGRYISFAKNLSHGFYSPPPPNINLWSGPGYPLFILPFIAAGLSLVYITAANAILHYLSIVILYKSLRLLVSEKIALIFSLFWACYFNAFQNMALVRTEVFSIFLVVALIYCLIVAFQQKTENKNNKHFYFAGILFGYLILTKIIFGYVLLIMLLSYVLLSLVNKKVANFKFSRTILLVGLLINIPYLIYTHYLTGKWLYWGNSGGQSLYWMSTPYEDEFGDWKGDLTLGTLEMGNYNIIGADDSLKARHGKDYEEIYKLPKAEQDDAYKRIAIKNIKTHPVKYIRNIVYNTGRLFFHYPFSFAIQRTKTLFVIPLNSILFAFLLFSLIPTAINWRSIDFAIRIMVIIIFLYLGFTLLVSTYSRMLTVVVPFLLVWFAYMLEHTIKLNFTFRKK